MCERQYKTNRKRSAKGSRCTKPCPVKDPRNEDDFDTWAYGTEPLPKDTTWCASKKIYDTGG